MLQRLAKEKPGFRSWFILSLFLFPGCKPDTSTHSEEEAAYMADYEAPANKWGFMDTLGNLVIEPIYDDVGAFSEGLAAVNVKGKWGFINTRGKLVIQPQYKSAWSFHENKARVKPFDQPEQFIDRSGIPMKTDVWSAADNFNEGLARVLAGTTFGYVDTSGKLVIQPIYSRGWNFQHGMAIIEYEEKLGVIHKSGDTLLPAKYDEIKIDPSTGVMMCRLNDKSYAFSPEGKELSMLREYKMIETDGNLVAVRKGDKMIFYDLKAEALKSQLSFSNIIFLGGQRWAGKKENQYFLIDQEGNILKEKGYTQINKISEGVAAYYTGTGWGYLDRDGNELTSDVFGLAWDYKEGFARAAFKEGIAFIDRHQKLSFYPPAGTLDMRDFAEGMAPIKLTR